MMSFTMIWMSLIKDRNPVSSVLVSHSNDFPRAVKENVTTFNIQEIVYLNMVAAAMKK